MAKVTDEEYNLILRYTSETHLDSVIDITGNDKEDFFWDYEEDEKLSLKEGFKILADSVAYPFSHEGFTKKESEILTNVIRQYVPSFNPPEKE